MGTRGVISTVNEERLCWVSPGFLGVFAPVLLVELAPVEIEARRALLPELHGLPPGGMIPRMGKDAPLVNQPDGEGAVYQAAGRGVPARRFLVTLEDDLPMVVFQRLFAAVARLADAVTGLAATLETANGELQSRLALAGPSTTATLPAPASKLAPGERSPSTEGEDTTPPADTSRGWGRKRAA
jgi:hypothetical protein